MAFTQTSYTVSLSKFLRVYEAYDVREAIGTSTGMMDCSQELGATLEEDSELTITPVNINSKYKK